MKLTPWIVLMVLLVPSAFAASPGDDADGKRLYDANCTGCHDTSVFTRKDRTVHSLAALKEQLDGCTHATKKEFSPAEMQSIVRYLNDRFYRFK